LEAGVKSANLLPATPECSFDALGGLEHPLFVSLILQVNLTDLSLNTHSGGWLYSGVVEDFG
jgi:hypothetical protein